jgi:hypothetical protein
MEQTLPQLEAEHQPLALVGHETTGPPVAQPAVFCPYAPGSPGASPSAGIRTGPLRGRRGLRRPYPQPRPARLMLGHVPRTGWTSEHLFQILLGFVPKF